jgi:CheY-like chemotaxis protein
MLRQDAQRDRHGRIPSRQHRRVRVLVVDDSADNVESTAMVLRLFGHEVDTALGGGSALEAARQTRPDVVFLDVAMPGMDGFELARRLREMYRERITIVAVTAYGYEEGRERYLEAGIDAHFVKPADPNEMENLLRELAGSVAVRSGES